MHFVEKNNNNIIDYIKIKRITDIVEDKVKNNTLGPIEQIHIKKTDFIKSMKILTKIMM